MSEKGWMELKWREGERKLRLERKKGGEERVSSEILSRQVSSTARDLLCHVSVRLQPVWSESDTTS